MRLYAEPSVIAGLVLAERGWPIVAAALRSPITCSDFGKGEAMSTLASHARANRFDRSVFDDLTKRLAGLLGGWDAVPVTSADIERATATVARFELALRLPDAIHIAIAERLGATLVTSDRQQHRAALALGTASINPLESPNL